jgi:hypothetical protein
MAIRVLRAALSGARHSPGVLPAVPRAAYLMYFCVIRAFSAEPSRSSSAR